MVNRIAALLVLVLSTCMSALAVLPTAPVLSPSGLDADGGDGKVYLEWNPNTEPAVTGYNVYRWTGAGGKDKTRLTERPIIATVFTDGSATNDTSYSYAVTAVYGGAETRLSTSATARAAKVAAAKAGRAPSPAPTESRRGPTQPQTVLTITFANGHSIAFDTDRMKWCDWHSPEGQRLLNPRSYGNPIDLCSYNNQGFSETQPATAKTPLHPAAHQHGLSAGEREPRGREMGG